jgi:hypothetical protein
MQSYQHPYSALGKQIACESRLARVRSEGLVELYYQGFPN